MASAASWREEFDRRLRVVTGSDGIAYVNLDTSRDWDGDPVPYVDVCTTGENGRRYHEYEIEELLQLLDNVPDLEVR